MKRPSNRILRYSYAFGIVFELSLVAESSEDEFADQEEYAGPGISQDKLDEVLEKKFKALKIEFSDLVKNGIDASLLPLNKDINKLMQSFKTS